MQYPQGAFKIAMVDGWNVILNGDQYINDLNRADPNVLNSAAALTEVIRFFCFLWVLHDIDRHLCRQVFQFQASFGEKVTKLHNLITIIRTSFKRNIDPRFRDIVEEVIQSFDGGIPCEGEGDSISTFLLEITFKYVKTAWTAVPAYQLAVDVVVKVTSRYLFDRPLCTSF